MKKIVSLLSFVFAGTLLFAGPADPSPHVYTQPDGSVVRYYMHGDEYLHWMTDDHGNVIEIGADGFVSPSRMPVQESFSGAAERRMAGFRPRVAESSGLEGAHTFCVILVEFNDVKFTKTAAQFNTLFNGSGQESGSTGSVKEYWTDQSCGRFTPSFDIYGPIALPVDLSVYQNDRNGLVSAAASAADPLIDFSKYKNNGENNGIDGLVIISAGHSGATGAYGIWPGMGTMYSSPCSTAEGRIYSYCCGPELNGSSGTTIAGIGHICHELGHCFGLPDMYDTKRNSHTYAAEPCYTYCLMDYGSYNDDSKTPPPLSMYEKYLCGWLDNDYNDGIETVTTSGSKTIGEIGRTSGIRALRIDTDMADEFFMCEYRSINSGVNKWSKGLPKGGMIVYHIDKSERSITIDGETFTAGGFWPNGGHYYNSINNNYQHPLFYLVNAADQDRIQLYSERYSFDWASLPFPGNSNITSYNPCSWNGTDAYVSLTGMPNIAASSTRTTISVNAHVRSFPLINNPGKGVYSSGDKFYLKLSSGLGDTSTVTTWRYDGTPTSDEYITLSSGSHCIEAVLDDSRTLRLDISVK